MCVLPLGFAKQMSAAGCASCSSSMEAGADYFGEEELLDQLLEALGVQDEEVAARISRLRVGDFP